MEIIKIKTRKILPPKDSIYPILDSYLPKLREGDVLFITSKILGIHQGRCVKVGKNVSKDKLIMQEAEAYIPPSQVPNGEMFLTIKEYILVPVAGIDESNGNGYYILWPKQSSKLAKEICGYLKQKHHIKKLAMIVTDSHTTPLRYGVTGISLGFFGLEPLYDYRGKPDIFGRKLKFTKSNIVDALSALAVLAMGEGKEQTPMAIIREANFVQFTNRNTYKKLVIPPTLDIYSPLLKVFKEKKWKTRK